MANSLRFRRFFRVLGAACNVPTVCTRLNMEKLDQRIQLVASVEFNNVVDRWRREQADLPSRSEAIRRLVLHGLEYEKSFPMRMITAIIRPHKYEELRDALVAIGLEGITVTQVQGFGRQRGHSEIYRGAEYQVMEVPKVRIDVAVSAELVEKAVRVIERAASTGKTGDGKIFVQPLEQVVRIRTGETNETALG